MGFPTKLNQLCTPAKLYFILSAIGLVVAAIQNVGNKGSYTLGMMTCRVPSCLAVFVLKVVYVLFWTWVLNLMCKDGHSGIAWFLVLLPFILLFLVVTGLAMYQRKHSKKDGMCNCGK